MWTSSSSIQRDADWTTWVGARCTIVQLARLSYRRRRLKRPIDSMSIGQCFCWYDRDGQRHGLCDLLSPRRSSITCKYFKFIFSSSYSITFIEILACINVQERWSLLDVYLFVSFLYFLFCIIVCAFSCILLFMLHSCVLNWWWWWWW